jgi:hypothetical protein
MPQPDRPPISILADVILAAHVAFTAFVVIGFVLIVLGGLRKWHWVRNPWFRIIHLAAIGVVVVQAWCGTICPLTTWEMTIREQTGGAAYQGSFIAHWLQAILYYDFPAWVFTLCYTVFALFVLACCVLVRPRPFTHRKHSNRGTRNNTS